MMLKNFFLLFIVTGILMSCDNNKTPEKKADYRNDDYSDTDDDENDNVGRKNGKDGQADYTDGGEWSRTDKKAFDEKCLETLENDAAKAKIFCPCFFEKISKKYASMKEIDEKSNEEEGKRLATLCMDETGLGKKKNDFNDDDENNTGGWTRSDENKFVNECSGTAAPNLGEARASQYCNCMLKKMKREYPSYAAAEKALQGMSQEEIKELAADCNR